MWSRSIVIFMVVCICHWAFAVDDAGKPLPSEWHDRRERHLANIIQLTFGGENAEAYFSFDERSIIYQAHGDSGCDQIYIMTTDGRNKHRVSTGMGRTTCSYFLPNGEIIYASTHEHSPECPPVPDRSHGYLWPLYPEYEIYRANSDGTNLRCIIRSSGYDAEATVSPTGDRIVFTSTRDGDIELYSCDLDGSNVRRLTHEFGYDGGAFFSFDGSKIVFRASRPKGKDSIEYAELLQKHLVRPRALEIFVMDSDGTNIRQVTNNGAANFAPFFHPDGKRIIFASNMADPSSRNFDLYIINIDGTGLERITYYEGFDGFPMFSRDGKKLIFCSNRNGSRPGETNVFICDWVE
jgi:Tol biopolymer transport system component